METEIRRLPVEAIRPLRAAVLRPGRPLEDAVWDGDDLPTTWHFGAVDAAGSIVGVASLLQRSSPHREGPAWQLRGMAVAPEHQGRGVGQNLLRGALREITAEGIGWCWCNARTTAAGFYVREGFVVVGAPFDLPGIGPHVRMERLLAVDP